MKVPAVKMMGRGKSRGRVWGREGHSPVRAVARKGNQQLIAVSKPFSYVIALPTLVEDYLLFCSAHAVSAISLSLVREDSATDLSLSGVSTPTLNCLLADR